MFCKENFMRMSTKGRFAVNALIDLALREASGPVALATIGLRQKVSLSYLEQLFGKLRRDGIVESTRGPGGGYTLAREAAQISVADIVSAVDDPLDSSDGESAADGLSRALWLRLNTVMLAHMANISLQSLVQEQQAQGAAVEVRRRPRPLLPQPVVKALRTTAPNSVFAFGRYFAR
jgi:Rrf2 family transcriptional regulator, iron-sulfur cluster assembly transcription factor